MTGFITLADGRSVIYKDKDARKPYGINLAPVIAAEGSPVKAGGVSISGTVGVQTTTSAGVNGGSPFLQGGNIAAVWLKGGDADLGLNSVTFDYELESGYKDQATLYFRIREN